ncbi:glycosyltransferase [Candidatus Parcubacteria bacterium]|nr:glycosyltransferase [Candidatus Parcubacteria bacterium]
MERGFSVEIFSLHRGETNNISQVFHTYNMADYTYYLDMPGNILKRLYWAIPKAVHLLIKNPAALARAFNVKKYGRQALSLQLLFWAEPLIDKKFDLYHCHFGTVANRFLDIRYVLGSEQKFITSFYGQDVSKMFQVKGDSYYDQLKKDCSGFIAMSEFMKKRLVAKGFDENKVHAISIFGIDVNDYPFQERVFKTGEIIQMVSVGRLVEKKGFEDLLRALAIVKQKTDKNFSCSIIGGGPLEDRLHKVARDLNLEDMVSFKGFMKLQEVIKYFKQAHLYLQPSKTASDGDME